jgi:hypothetical protein
MQFVRDDGQWTINGGTWDDRQHRPKSQVRTNDVEADAGQKSGGWHPAHIHFIDFRSSPQRPPQPQDGAKTWFWEAGRWLLIKFDEGRGKFTERHNLVHEDHSSTSTPAGERLDLLRTRGGTSRGTALKPAMPMPPPQRRSRTLPDERTLSTTLGRRHSHGVAG